MLGQSVWGIFEIGRGYVRTALLPFCRLDLMGQRNLITRRPAVIGEQFRNSRLYPGCREQGVPITEEWFIPQKAPALHELTDFESLSERLYYDYDFGESSAADTARALLTPYRERTEDQMLDLTAAWHNHKIPGDLQTFLRLTDTEMEDFLSPSKTDLQTFHLDYADLVHEGRIRNLQPFHHTPGDKHESAFLAYIGGALETEFSCFTAEIDKKPVVMICSPNITQDGFLDDYGQKRAWTQLRVCEMQKDPSLSSFKLYLEENSELEYGSSLIAVLPADTEPKTAASCVEGFQQAFNHYLCTYSMEDLQYSSVSRPVSQNIPHFPKCVDDMHAAWSC